MAALALPEECKGLEKILGLTAGCHVICQNLWTKMGLVSVTTDIVHNILHIPYELKKIILKC